MTASDGVQPAGSRCCTRIDVHSHFLPPVYRDALRDAGLATVDGGMPIPNWSDADALTVMDQFSIACSIISVSSPAVNFLEDAAAARLARAVNKAAADVRRMHPERFGAFATLPLPDVAGSLAEIAYAFDTLEADGVVLETNANGIYLGDPSLAPVFDELNRRQAVVFLHPTSPACFAKVGLGRPAPMIEFPFDTTRTVVDLIFSGTLARCPDLKIIVPHGGGTLPFLAQRIAGFSALPFVKSAAGGPPAIIEALKRLYYDTTQATSLSAFSSLRGLIPLSQLLYGSDWPFTPVPVIGMGITEFEALPDLSDQERAAIEHGNALRLFPRLQGSFTAST